MRMFYKDVHERGFGRRIIIIITEQNKFQKWMK